MDWKSLPPMEFKFTTMEEYGEWLAYHSSDIPLKGQVLLFSSKAEDWHWIRVGNGIDKLCDLDFIKY